MKKNQNKTVIVVELSDWLKVLKYRPFPQGKEMSQLYLRRLSDVQEPLDQAIAAVFKELHIGNSPIVISFPRYLATARILHLPSSDPAEIDSMVHLQISKQTPYSQEEIISAYRLTGTDKEGYSTVMLVLARNNLIHERVVALQTAGIEIEKIILSSEGAYHWLRSQCPGEISSTGEHIAYVSVDSNYSDVIVVHNGVFVYTKSILIGSNQFSLIGGHWQEKFVEEIKQSLELQDSTGESPRISKIILSRAEKDRDAHLEHVLQERLNIPLKLVDPLGHFQVAEDERHYSGPDIAATSLSPLFGAAVGFDDMQIDLSPRELRIQKLMHQKRKQFTVLGVLLTSIVTVVSLFVLLNIQYRNNYLDQLKKRLSAIQKDAREVERMLSAIEVLNSRLDARKSSINILKEVYGLTPVEIYFSNVDIEENKQTSLKGRARAMSDVFKFVAALEESPYFENVKTIYTTTKKEKDGGEYAVFEIVCQHEAEDPYSS